MRELQASLDQGLQRAKVELGVTNEPLADEQLGVGVKYALLDRLLDRVGSLADARSRAREGQSYRVVLRAMAEEDLPELLDYARLTEHSLHAPWLTSSAMQSRLIDVMLDALFSEPLAPELVFPSAEESLPAGSLHGLIFSTFSHITHELFPLMVDAYVANPELTVVGVHLDWLEDGRARRVIRFDITRQQLREISVSGAARLISAQALALNLSHEALDHDLAEALLPEARMLNPCAGAMILDDKVRTASIWRAAGLSTPAFLALPRARNSQAARDALASFIATQGKRIVLKPTDGTEGRHVGIFDFAQGEQRAAAFRHLDLLLSGGAVLALEERGLLRYTGEHGPVRVAVRINVCWDGARAWVESGYAQVAAHSTGIASAGQGGRVLALAELWPRLCRENGQPFAPTRDDWACLLATAREGTTALANSLTSAMPALVGLDLLLDLDEDDHLFPVLLEANPRPAGMARCALLSADGPTDEPGIAPHLWDVVARITR